MYLYFSFLLINVSYLVNLPCLSGQFICGNKHCDKRDGLTSYEVSACNNDPFFYLFLFFCL